MAERMQELKPAIMQTVVSQEYSDWMKGLPAKVKDEAQAVKKLALDEPGFWGKQEIMVEVFAPVVKTIAPSRQCSACSFKGQYKMPP